MNRPAVLTACPWQSAYGKASRLCSDTLAISSYSHGADFSVRGFLNRKLGGWSVGQFSSIHEALNSVSIHKQHEKYFLWKNSCLRCAVRCAAVHPVSSAQLTLSVCVMCMCVHCVCV